LKYSLRNELLGHPVCTVSRRLPASLSAGLRDRTSSYREVAAYRLAARMHCFAKWKSSVHFKSTEALADCTISIGAFAGGKTRDGALSLPLAPSAFLLRVVGAVECRGFNGQIARFVRGNRISIADQLLTVRRPDPRNVCRLNIGREREGKKRESRE